MAGDTSPSRRAQQPDSAAPSSTSSEPAGAAPAASSNGVPPRRDPGLRLGGFTQLKHDLPDSDDEQDGDGPWRTPVGPVTPSIAETAQQLRRSLSVHGLHELAQNPKQLRSKIWRPDDEQARIPTDAERTLVHSLRGGMRAWIFAFGCRGTVMLLLALVKAFRSKAFRANGLMLAYFGPENVRFASMFGLWAAIYKAVHNTLRLVTPMPQRPSSRAGRSEGKKPAAEPRSQHGSPTRSGTATPRSGWQELEGKSSEERAKLRAKQEKRAFMRDPRSKVWHAYVAGAVSGLAILADKKENRIGLAQQLVVRGLEGTYNLAHGKGLVNIPYGAVLAFGLACGQIMYAWLDAPETLPRGYMTWITNASKVAPMSLKVHKEIPNVNSNDVFKLFPDGKFPEALPMPNGKLRYPNLPPTKHNRRGITGLNASRIIAWKEAADRTNGASVAERPYVPCALVHPWEDNHIWSPVDRFVEVTRWILPVYSTLYFVPAVFLRMGSFRKDPVRVLSRAGFGALRSSTFLGVFVIIFQTLFCGAHSLVDLLQKNPTTRNRVPQWLLFLLTRGPLHWGAGFLTCLSLFIEHERRRAELAMYVIPKAAESAWALARRASWVPFVPGGDLLLTSAGMSLVMGTYAQNPQLLSGLVRRIVYQFVGHN